MRSAQALAFVALLGPALALGQTSYSEARIVGRDSGTLTRDELRRCMARDEAFAERRAALDHDKADVDRESADIADEGARLADELRRLDARDAAAVAAYDARSAGHNRRVDAHNRRVAELNARTAAINDDSAHLDALCARPFMPSDRDAVLLERGSIR